jgi:5-oxoprolinase (ATP-hydrolysing)
MIMIIEPEDGDYASAFTKEHQREFSFILPNRKVLVENLRIRGRANAGIQSIKKKSISSEMYLLPTESLAPNDQKSLRVYFEGGWTDAPLHLLKNCTPGDTLLGPAMIYDDTQMIIVQPGAMARILHSHVVIDLTSDESSQPAPEIDSEPLTEDPIQLSVMSNRFMGIAEQMGLTLQKTSVSVNIKERLDFSCALFGVGHIYIHPYYCCHQI